MTIIKPATYILEIYIGYAYSTYNPPKSNIIIPASRYMENPCWLRSIDPNCSGSISENSGDKRFFPAAALREMKIPAMAAAVPPIKNKPNSTATGVQ